MRRSGARRSAPTGAPSIRRATTRPRGSGTWPATAGSHGPSAPTPSTTTRASASPPAFALSPDGDTLAAARPDGRVDLIDAETLRRTGGFEAFAGRSALAIEYSPDGRRLAVAGGGGGVGLWDAGSGQRVGPLLRAPRGPELDNPHNVQALAFGRGGLLAAAGVGGSGTGRGAVRIWDLDGRKLIGRPLHLPPRVRGLAFSPDGSQLAIAFGARRAEAPPARRPRRRRGSRRPQRRDARHAARRRGPLGRLLPRRPPARGRPARRQRPPLGDGRLGAGGGAAGLPRRGIPIGGLLPGRPHAGHLRRRRRGRALGRRLPAADRPAASGPAGRPDDGALRTRRRSPVRGLRRGARDPLGGRPRGLAATARAPSPAAASRPSSGRSSSPSRTTSRSAPRADTRPPRARRPRPYRPIPGRYRRVGACGLSTGTEPRLIGRPGPRPRHQGGPK